MISIVSQIPRTAKPVPSDCSVLVANAMTVPKWRCPSSVGRANRILGGPSVALLTCSQPIRCNAVKRGLRRPTKGLRDLVPPCPRRVDRQRVHAQGTPDGPVVRDRRTRRIGTRPRTVAHTSTRDRGGSYMNRKRSRVAGIEQDSNSLWDRSRKQDQEAGDNGDESTESYFDHEKGVARGSALAMAWL